MRDLSPETEQFANNNRLPCVPEVAQLEWNLAEWDPAEKVGEYAPPVTVDHDAALPSSSRLQELFPVFGDADQYEDGTSRVLQTLDHGPSKLSE